MDTSIEERPWGTWKVVHTEGERTVKVLTVNPGCMLSLQSHDLRTEYWQPLGDGLIAFLDVGVSINSASPPKVEYMAAGRIYRVGKGVAHRLINPTDRAISVVEVINGIYDESDIVRYHDAYGRV